jgi:plastocyanin
VIIENMQYNRPELRVHRGDRIVWVNKGLFPHTVTLSRTRSIRRVSRPTRPGYMWPARWVSMLTVAPFIRR